LTKEGKIEQLIEQADMIGFAYPIYGSDVPIKMLDFIKNIPSVEEKTAFIFTTMLAFSGDGAIVAMRKLRKKGYKVKQAVNILMPNNVRLPYIIVRRLRIRIKEEDLKKIRNRAIKKIDKLVNKIVKGKKWRLGRDPFSIAGGLAQRVPMKIVGWSPFAKNYFVDMETCTECMICVNFCPVNNITFEDNKFSWGKSCIGCLRCYNLCPEDAVQHKKGSLKRDKYPRYKGPGDGFSIAKLKK
jgi:Pyruvate/2-oxoacid:ferredoxin oxidoreductase delta subunit